MLSGITKVKSYPFTALTIARPTPVFPDVGSMILVSLLIFPSFSAASIMARAILSFTLPPGLVLSSFIQTLWFGNSLLSLTTGVLPMVSNTLLNFII